MARRLKALVACVVIAIAFPSIAAAQSSFTGVVKDSSGGVLPGVSVEASSPVLIEGSKSDVTNSNGQYRITDLRPGTYTVTFSLPGFKQVRQEKVELRVDFTGTLNASLEVGALEEAITVTGSSPTVDVSSNAKVEVMTSEILEQVPTGRTIQALAQLVSGVSLNVPDVGGSRAMQQSYMSTRGLTSANNIVTVDGLMVNGLDGDGAVQQYFNQAMMEEMSYQTSGAGADVSPGGVRMNIVPKDGGNRFSGAFFGSWNDKKFQSKNLTDDIIARGLRTGGGVDRIYDFNLAIGGPIKKDKLWFFTSGRMWSVNCAGAGRVRGAVRHVLPHGHRGVPKRRASAARRASTTRASRARCCASPGRSRSKHKFSVYYDEINKSRGHGMNSGDDYNTASQIWTSPKYNSAAAKYTGTLSNQLLAEAGYSFNYEQYVITNQDGVNKTAVLARVVRRCQPPRPEQRGPHQRPGQLGRPLPRPLQHDGRPQLHHGLAQHQGRRAVQLGPVREHARGQRRPAAGLRRHGGRAVHQPGLGHRLQHAAPLRGEAEGRRRRLRPGLVGAQPADGQHRPAVGVPGARSGRPVLRRRPFRRRTHGATPSRCPPGRTSRRASAWSTTCSATRRRPSRPASTATTSRARRSSPPSTTRWR